jgi:hypothetical protein
VVASAKSDKSIQERSMSKEFLSKSNLADFTTAELVQWYNENSGGAPVKRFADRATAEKRVLLLMERLPGGKNEAPVAEPEAPAAPPSEEAPAAGNKATKPRKAKKTAAAKKAAKTPEQRSAAVKASWGDKKTRAARSARYNVKVDGVLYDSTLKAFTALKLNTAPHQRIRRELVANGKVEHEGRKFVLVPKEE